MSEKMNAINNETEVGNAGMEGPLIYSVCFYGWSIRLEYLAITLC